VHSYVNAGPVRLHYAEIPANERPAILIHGIGMDWRVWQAISRRLHPHFRLFLLDLRGHGESSKPPSGYSLAHYAADVEDMIDTLALDDVALIGSSLGGMVALSVEAPIDIVGCRILVDPPITGGPVRDSSQLREILRLKHESTAAVASYLAGINPGAGRHLLRTMSEMWHNASDAVITELLEHERDYFAVDAALRADSSPTLLMRADPALGAALSAEESARALRLLPHGAAVTVSDAGHAIHAYRPREFTQLVVEFAATGRVDRASDVRHDR